MARPASLPSPDVRLVTNSATLSIVEAKILTVDLKLHIVRLKSSYTQTQTYTHIVSR
jgi:hypothetical protein